MPFNRAITDYVKGQTTKGRCANCGHTDKAVPGCRCSSGWCPCHRGHTGHGGHTCRCK